MSKSFSLSIVGFITFLRNSLLFCSRKVVSFEWRIFLMVYILNTLAPSVNKKSSHFLLCSADLIVHSSSKNDLAGDNPLKQLYFCMNCPHPQSEGSVVNALIAKYSVRDYDITSQVVYCIPNGAESSKLVNKSQFIDRIVLVDRGKQTTMQEKISRIASVDNDGGATAILIADDGQCLPDFSFCGKRASSL